MAEYNLGFSWQCVTDLPAPDEQLEALMDVCEMHPTWAWEHLYGNVTAGGGVSWQNPVHAEMALLRP